MDEVSWYCWLLNHFFPFNCVAIFHALTSKLPKNKPSLAHTLYSVWCLRAFSSFPLVIFLIRLLPQSVWHQRSPAMGMYSINRVQGDIHHPLTANLSFLYSVTVRQHLIEVCQKLSLELGSLTRWDGLPRPPQHGVQLVLHRRSKD